MSFVSMSRGNDNSWSVNDEMLTKMEALDSIVVRKAYVHQCGRADTNSKSPNYNIKIFQVSQLTAQWYFLLFPVQSIKHCLCLKGRFAVL